MAPTPPSGALAHLESTLGSLLQPITHNLPEPLIQTGHTLLGDQCYTSLIHSINLFSDPECLKLAISKALGIAIIGASSIVKIPQLLKLLNSQSAAGISFLSYLLETSSYLITLMYNVRNGFPFSTYGELALIAVQNVAISVLVLQFSGKGPAAAVFVAGLAAAGYALYNDSIVSAGMLQYLQAGAGVLGVASKLPQIITIFQEGGTGQLSAFAVFNFLLGSLARVFTTLQEVDDKLILYGFLAGFALNAVLAAQMVYYWNSPASKSTTHTKLKPSGKNAAKQAVGSDTVANKMGATTTGAEKGRSTPSTRRRG
ncbi:mannose-P-dolichol utilization defect 1 protein [Teratosphaeria nubilosa]|uniref:Mannose-P-dolichol utilization defect 1 protein n=1 Tax=Teratosphaeria nubilosa TaxID=161662 RepID=A0A6G1LDU6_9PEZI|nr:mannose-P-dolichol utilization defect 1 protein [Teratosphaeria nubilosa]